MSADEERVRLQPAQAAFTGGDYVLAYRLASEVVRSTRSPYAARSLCVNAAMQLGRWLEAIDHLQQLRLAGAPALAVSRGLAQCWLKQGNQLKHNARPAQAEQAYRAALQALPNYADAHYNLALMLLDSQRPTEALSHLNQLDDHADEQLARLRAYTALGRWPEAEFLRDLIAAKAQSLDDRLDAERASAALATPLQLAPSLQRYFAAPDNWRATLAYAAELRTHGDLDAAQEILDFALQRQHDETARLRLIVSRGLGLPAVVNSAEELTQVRAQFVRGLDQLESDYTGADIARLQPQASAFAWDNFYLAYHGENDRELQRRFGQWLSTGLQTRLPQYAQAPQRAPRQQPRIALVSTFLRHCTVGTYFVAWAEHLARCGFEVVSVLLQAMPDTMSERYGRCGRLLHLTGGLESAALGIAVLEADLIIYPELGMDAQAFALAALRLAPRQACAWGHPITSGLPTIDAYFSCAEMETDEASTHYTESLRVLPGLGTAYPPPHLPPPRTSAELGLPQGRPLYLLPQSPFKLHPQMDAFIADLVQQDPSALILGFLGPSSGASVRLSRRIERALRERGLEPGHHLRWLPACSRDDYLALNRVCDVMLDSLRWSGGNASIDALSVGLPVITCPGELMRGRQTQAMLRRLGRTDWIAATPQEQIETAIRIARERQADPSKQWIDGEAWKEWLGDIAPLQRMVEHVRELLAQP